MTTYDETPRTTPRTARAGDGRWLGGVCAGVAPVRGLGAGRLRLAFVLGALAGGLGIIVYLACWLIIPGPAQVETEDGEAPPGVVVLVRALAGAAGLALLALLGAVLTVFGFGWIIVGVCAALLAGVLAGWRRLGAGWALLPIVALTLPAVAVAAAGLSLRPETGATIRIPPSVAQVRATDYRSGLGTMLIDMRHLSFPASGTIPLQINAGVRRTIVALPTGQCVHVLVHYDVNPLLVRLASLLDGHDIPIFSDLVLFGRIWDSHPANQTVTSGPGRSGPLLEIDFSSQGGSLYVRDYPESVDPDGQPDWPGYPVHPELRPDTRGVPKKAAKRLVAAWHVRLRSELASQRKIDALLPGPCG